MLLAENNEHYEYTHTHTHTHTYTHTYTHTHLYTGSAEIVKGTGMSESPLNLAQTFTDPLCSLTV